MALLFRECPEGAVPAQEARASGRECRAPAGAVRGALAYERLRSIPRVGVTAFTFGPMQQYRALRGDWNDLAQSCSLEDRLQDNFAGLDLEAGLLGAAIYASPMRQGSVCTFVPGLESVVRVS